MLLTIPGTARNAAERLQLEWRLALFRAATALVALQGRLLAAQRRGLAAMGMAPATEPGPALELPSSTL